MIDKDITINLSNVGSISGRFSLIQFGNDLNFSADNLDLLIGSSDLGVKITGAKIRLIMYKDNNYVLKAIGAGQLIGINSIELVAQLLMNDSI